MKLIKSFMFLFLIISALATANENISKDSAFKTASEFCQLEFSYNDSAERDNMIKISPACMARARKLGIFAGAIQIDSTYEIFAVRSFKILDISVKGNDAIATVSYDIVAKRTGWQEARSEAGNRFGRSIYTKLIDPNYIEKIHLVFENNRWYVLDPPSPKISIDKIIDFYEKDMAMDAKNYPEVKVGNAPIAVLTTYDDNKNTIALLKSLK